MEIKVPKGRYVLAVSGGVDSMVLLDLLHEKPGLELIVAHFNHGIRKDSGADEKLVKSRAGELNLPFAAGYGRLGPKASEETARNARYGFLRAIQAKYQAKAVITAHHQDDLIETALMNVLRGTGRKGLSSLSDREGLLRPLLGVPKEEIISYAKKENLRWNEDSTNSNPDYLRNYIRRNVLPKLTIQQKQNLISNLDKVAKLNIRIDNEIATISHYILLNNQINRLAFASLPDIIGAELLSYWLREAQINDFDRATVSRLSLAIKTARPGSLAPIKNNSLLEIKRDTVHLGLSLNKTPSGLI